MKASIEPTPPNLSSEPKRKNRRQSNNQITYSDPSIFTSFPLLYPAPAVALHRQRVRRRYFFHAPRRPQTARLKMCGRLKQQEAESLKQVCKIQPLWHEIAIGTVFIIVAKTAAHFDLLFPTAVLQRQDF